MYKYLIKSYTSLDIDPLEIHQYGLKEVTRIHKEMLIIKDKLGFKDNLDKFNDSLTLKISEPSNNLLSSNAFNRGPEKESFLFINSDTNDGYLYKDVNGDYIDDESSEEEVWCCSYCDKEFDTEKGALFHEYKYCKRNPKRYY